MRVVGEYYRLNRYDHEWFLKAKRENLPTNQ